MVEEIIITDLYEAALEKERISEKIEADKWRVLDYECAYCSGRLLCVSPTHLPKPITIKLNAHGRYRIYLGMMQMKGAVTTTSLRLSNTDEISQVSPQTRYNWTTVETMVESYWKTEELDGDSLIIDKPKDYIAHGSSLAWIRLVPTEAEAKREKCITYHLDSDYFADDDYPTCSSVCGRMDALCDGGAELILQESFACTASEDYDPDPVLYPRAAKYKWFHENKEEIENALIKKAHGIGAKIYAAYRVEATQFTAPNDFSGINMLFCDSYDDVSEYKCVSRDGRELGMCSFAYPAVRDKIINYLESFLERDFDGLSLIFNRGIFVAFEKPICDEVMRRYGVDARRLPMDDPRYRTVAASFITEFMRELRAELDEKYDEHKGVNAVVMFTPEDSKRIGLDVEQWVKEGLVDSVSQGLMRIFEDLDGCLGEDGLINLERYKEQLLLRSTVKREFRATPQNLDLIVKGAEEFKKICGDTVDFHATLLWEAQTEEETLCITDRLKEIGIKKFISWNSNHKAKLLARINAEKYYAAGNSEEYETKKSRYYRTLSVGGADVSQFDPNWKG